MKAIVTTGKRKTAIARATLKPGTGKLTVNNLDVAVFNPAIARLKLQTLGAKIDRLTAEQKKYLSSWQVGT